MLPSTEENFAEAQSEGEPNPIPVNEAKKKKNPREPADSEKLGGGKREGGGI